MRPPMVEDDPVNPNEDPHKGLELEPNPEHTCCPQTRMGDQRTLRVDWSFAEDIDAAAVD